MPRSRWEAYIEFRASDLPSPPAYTYFQRNFDLSSLKAGDRQILILNFTQLFANLFEFYLKVIEEEGAKNIDLAKGLNSFLRSRTSSSSSTSTT